MSDSNVLYALEDRCLYIKLTGEIRHTVCSGFDALIQQSIQMDQADRFVVDLRETQYLDSTTLGIIARMARHMQNKSKGKPVIISTNDDVNQILNSVQFGSVTEIVTDWKHLPDQYLESDTFMKKSRSHHDIILESHRELTNTNDDNKKRFAAVIESLERKKQKEH